MTKDIRKRNRILTLKKKINQTKNVKVAANKNFRIKLFKQTKYNVLITLTFKILGIKITLKKNTPSCFNDLAIPGLVLSKNMYYK